MGHPGVLTAGVARVRDHRLALARAAWVAALALTLGLFALGVPVLAAELRTPCAGAGCFRWQPSPQVAAELARRGLSLDVYAAYKLALEALFVLGFCAIAAVIAARRPDEPMALFAAVALVTFSGANFADTIRALALSAPLWWWPRAALACLGWAAFFVFFYLFPDGRFVPRWTRPAAAGWVALAALGSFSPPNWPVNQGAGATARADGGPLFTLGALACFASVVAAQVYRYRRVSSPAQRQQTKWVVCGFVAAFGGLAANILVVGPLLLRAGSHPLVADLVGQFIFYAVLLLLPLSLAAAILRHRLWDIDVLINRALVYGALTACVVGLYVLAVGYLGALFRTGGNLAISLVATGLVAVLFQPLRERLQRAANRLVYGERDDPYAVLSRLGQRLEGTLEPDAVLPTVCRTVVEALKLPYAAIALREDRELTVAATAGAPAAETLRLPLVYQGESVGELLLAPRAPGEAFGPADRRLLDDLARQAGVAAHAVRLTADLQRARERLVAAREEERRRLRRDLHDGLGPQLAGVTLRLDVVRTLLRRDPDQAEAVLLDLKARTQAAVTDIRRLVYGLRPPALDELGLAAAVRQHAASYAHDGLQIAVEAPDDLPPLPAAVEVAAYRIVQEALTNVVRHAGARACAVRLALDGALCLEVVDNGRGIPSTCQAGVGLLAMRERAAELGGGCEVAPRPGGGTRVRARLPLSRRGVGPAGGEE